ncbi:SlyX family protein [Sagittula sp. S175]|uniref:SlyX family protein n=1 Tax=Sagittula sp. S175 TaxID=3415129 RepID=UPI003C7ACFA3
MSDTNETNRILEERVAHLHNTVDELSDVVARQDAELRALTRRMEMLIRREAEREADAPGGVIIGDERPPHY